MTFMQKILFILLLLCGCSDSTVTEISPADLRPDALILDVRTAAEHEQVALEQKHWLVPLNQLNAADFIREHHLDNSTPLYILCRSGKRAAVAAQHFKKAGFNKAIVIQGGIIAAEKSGRKVVKK